LFRVPVAWPRGAFHHRYDIALRRGITVRGQVTDADTGKPVVGAFVQYHPRLDNNPFVEHELVSGSGSMALGNGTLLGGALTGADGVFQLPVQPGRGYLLIRVPGSGYAVRRVPEGLLEQGRAELGGRRIPVNGLIALNFEPKTQSYDVSISLH